MRFKTISSGSVDVCQRSMFIKTSTFQVVCLLIPLMSLVDYSWAADGKSPDSVSPSETLESLSVASSPSHGPAALEGKRLFFAEEERRGNAIGSAPVAAVTLDLPYRPEPLKIAEENRAAASDNSSSTRPQSAPVQYTAWLKSGLSIRVIINGVPCEAIERRVLEDSLQGIGLTCSSLESARMSLNIEKDGQTLTLSKGTTRLGKLHPGDTW